TARVSSTTPSKPMNRARVRTRTAARRSGSPRTGRVRPVIMASETPARKAKSAEEFPRTRSCRFQAYPSGEKTQGLHAHVNDEHSEDGERSGGIDAVDPELSGGRGSGGVIGAVLCHARQVMSETV